MRKIPITLEQVEELVHKILDERSRSPWMKPEEAATYLGTTVGNLVTWRSRGRGPKYHGGHRFTRYHRDECDAFLRGEANR